MVLIRNASFELVVDVAGPSNRYSHSPIPSVRGGSGDGYVCAPISTLSRAQLRCLRIIDECDQRGKRIAIHAKALILDSRFEDTPISIGNGNVKNEMLECRRNQGISVIQAPFSTSCQIIETAIRGVTEPCASCGMHIVVVQRLVSSSWCDFPLHSISAPSTNRGRQTTNCARGIHRATRTYTGASHM